MDTPEQRRIPLFPLSHGVFPDGLLPLNIFEVRYLDLIRRCHREGTPFGVAWLAQGREVQVPGEVPALHAHGCLAVVRELRAVQPTLLQVRCVGTTRFVLERHEPGPLGVWQGVVRLRDADLPVPVPATLQPVADELGRLIADAQRRGLADRLPMLPPYRLDECGWVANRLAEMLPLAIDDKQRLLAEDDPHSRLLRLAEWMA